MSEPTTAAIAGGAIVSAAAVQWLGVDPPSLIAAGFGTILALHISDGYPTKGKAITAGVSSFAIGVYGGQALHTIAMFAPMPVPVLCGLCAAIGIKIVPFAIDALGGLLKRTGGGNA